MKPMTTVLLQHPLAPEELRSLQSEFPHYEFVFQKPGIPLSEKDWHEVEILYGSQLLPEDLIHAHRLRWIHAPTSDLSGLCMKQIEETTNLLVSSTKDPDIHQQAEYAIGAMLAFGKNLFEWARIQGDAKEIWDSPYRELIWSFKGRTLLQIGLGHVGSAICERAEQLGMRTWGILNEASFHPHCRKTFSLERLHSLLPACDVVSIAIPRGQRVETLFKKQQLELMKNDSILIILGSEGIVDEEALAKIAGKFRGVLFDAMLRRKGKQTSPLWASKDVIVTPEVAGCPEPTNRLGFAQFHHNFRRYLHSDFTGMKNLVRQAGEQW